MRKAIMISLLLHCAFILHWLDRGWPSFSALFHPKANIRATLAAAPTSEKGPLPVVSYPGLESPIKSADSDIRKSAHRPVLPDLQTLTAANGAIPTSPVLSAAEPQSALPIDGERQYRLSLARQARRFKPSLPNEKAPGEPGIVLLAIIVQAGSPSPRVEMVQSSGNHILDQQALVMMRHAVEAAEMPSTIRARSFRMNLPVEFSAAD